MTDYYAGGSLFYHLRKSRGFAEPRARMYSAELLLALAHLHEHGIIYRDLKLENVLMDHHGHNALTELSLCWESLEHMQRLEAPSNEIAVFPRGVGCLQQLINLDLADNKIEQVPGLGSLTVKLPSRPSFTPSLPVHRCQWS